MPVVIPAAASSTSTAQSVSGAYVYDYILDDSGAAISGAKVIAILNGDFMTTISPQVLLAPIQRSTVTDGNGFWQLSLIPNSNISPANTTYTIITPFRTYEITVGASGPYQSTSTGTLVSTPTALAPATSGIIGPLSITGLLTVSAGATIAGGLTVSSGTFSIPGGAFSMAGPLTLTAATSQIIPGATSMAIRNNANGADNLLVSNAGLVTARAGLVATAGGVTATAGDVAVTAGNLTLGAAASRLVPGATSFAVRDTANANDNLLVSNAGAVTTRSAFTVTAGGLTVTAGGATVTAGNLNVTAGELIFAAATTKIVPGATSLSLRNNADNADNLLISNAGAVTVRAGLTVTASGANITGDLTLPTNSRVFSTGTAPTVGSAGAGISALAIAASSTNTSGSITATFTGVGAGTVVGVVTFNGAPISAAPRVVIVSLTVNSASAATAPAFGSFTYSTSSFTINVVNAPSNGTYTIGYWCIW